MKLPLDLLGFSLCLALLCGGWYVSWVKPNDERVHKILQCMESEYAEVRKQGTLLGPTENARELDRAIYDVCADQVASTGR